MQKSRPELEQKINNSAYFTITGGNMDEARKTAKEKLVLDLWQYCKDRPVYPGKKESDTFQDYGEELWKAVETSIAKFKPGDKPFLHYFNAYCKRFLKKEIYRAHEKMSEAGMLLSVEEIKRIKKIEECKEIIDKSGKRLPYDQKIDWISKLANFSRDEVKKAMENENAFCIISGDTIDTDTENHTTIFDGTGDTDSAFHKSIPTPEEYFETEEQRRRNIAIIEAIEYIFSNKTKESQKPLLKKILSLEYADVIPPDSEYSFMDKDLLAALKDGREFTRREIAVIFFPDKTTANAEATAKMALERFNEKVRKYLIEKSKTC